MKGDLSRYGSLEELSVAGGELVIKLANDAIRDRGIFTIALAGGSTPRRLYEVLGSKKYSTETDWSSWMIYFGDERVVPRADDRSNYAMAATSLFDKVPIEEGNIFAPPVKLLDPEVIATRYETMISRSFNNSTEMPRLDLILLGLGSDGHTASLFSGKSALMEQKRLVVASSPGVLPPPVDRITLTLPFINAARHILFLVSGADKIAAFQAAYKGMAIQSVPASLVDPKNGTVHWFITDELAFSE